MQLIKGLIGRDRAPCPQKTNPKERSIFYKCSSMKMNVNRKIIKFLSFTVGIAFFFFFTCILPVYFALIMGSSIHYSIRPYRQSFPRISLYRPYRALTPRTRTFIFQQKTTAQKQYSYSFKL